MVKKLLLAFCCAFGFVSMTCSAQQDTLTPYQKKVLEINIKYYCKIYYNKPYSSLSLSEQEIVEFELLDQAKAKALIYLGLAAYATEHSGNAADQLVSDYENEINAAAKLKNKTDLERDEREAEQKAKEKRQEEIKGTDYGDVIRELSKAFSKWCEKGEFEKQDVWYQRLMQQSEKIFTNLCNKIIPVKANCCKGVSNDYTHTSGLLKYDSEEEVFLFSFDELVLKLAIPISNAEQFKTKMGDNCDNYSISLSSMQNLFSHCFFVSHKASNYKLVHYKIFPKEIVFYNLERTDIINGTNYKYQNDCCSFPNKYENYKWEKLQWQELPYNEEDSMKLLNQWGRTTITIPCCVRENVNPQLEIEDVIIYFDDLGFDFPYMNGSSYNYTKQKFNPGETMVKIRAEEEKRQQKIKEEQEIRRKNDSIFNAANNKLQNEIADYHSLLKRTPYNYKENSLSLSIPKFLIGENQRLTDTLKILIDSVNILRSQLLERYKKDSLEFRQMSQSLQDKIDEANVQFLQYPYNVQKRTLKDSLSVSLFGKTEELAKELHAKVDALPKMQEQAEKEVYEKLIAEDPQRFTEIYFTQNPSKKQEADKSYIECRCKYKERLAFDMAFIHDTLTDCDCREKEYQIVSEFFHSREDFDQMYSQEELTYKIRLNKLKSMMADKKAIEETLFNSKQLNFKKSMLTSNEELKSVVNRINEHKGKYYYADVIDAVFKLNDKLAKEWEKNGTYFKSKAEMFEYWIGEEYDKVLKARKKE